MSDRLLVAIGYHGHKFHGSQIQPDVGTLEGSLIKALKRLTWWTEGCLEICSRTDAGVSVRMNLVRIDLPTNVSDNLSDESIVRALNDHLPIGAVALKSMKSNPDSKVRYAYKRQYVYRLETIDEWPYESDIQLSSHVCSLFEGQHDFSNFCRLEPDTDPIRTVDKCNPWFSQDGRMIGFSISARSFVWNQVRRIASAISGATSGRLSVSEIKTALENPERKVDFGRAPADGLILWSIYHSDFDQFLSEDLPSPDFFSRRPEDSREYRRWRSMSSYELSVLLEREWLARLA